MRLRSSSALWAKAIPSSVSFKSPPSSSAKRSICRVSATGNNSSISICKSDAISGKSALPLKGAAATASIRPASRFEDTCGNWLPMPKPGKRSWRAPEPRGWPQAARQLGGIGGFESVQADEIDRLQRSLAYVCLRHSLRFEAERDILEYSQPGKQGEALKYHGDARRGSGNRLAHV